ncbi:MAG: InlB B-repeat-containing protein [Oscillospiraceae bacterium]|nr:InlB B-repeat-containing protein [Oscillospiraceae bacterium]
MSLLCVLVLMLQLTGGAAWADNTSSVTGEEKLIYYAYVSAPSDDDPYAVELITDDNLQELLGDERFSVKLGEAEVSTSSEMQLQALVSEGLRITPPADYYVDFLRLRTNETGSPSVDVAAEASASTPAVAVNEKCLLDEDGDYAEDLFSAFSAYDAPRFVLDIVFTPIDKDASITVRYNLNGVSGSFDAETAEYGSTFSVPHVTEDQKAEAQNNGKVFDGWELRYANGTHTLVTEGAEIRPYASCILTAKWTDQAPLTVGASPQSNDRGTETEVHDVTVNNDENGTASAEPVSGVTGTEVTLTATPNDGYRLKEWQVEPDSVTITNNKFTIGDENVTVTAIFEEIPPATYSVTVTVEGSGTASASPTSGISGTEVALTATPNDGYHLKEWQVEPDSVAITDNKFTIGSENVTVKAIFEEIPVSSHTVTFDANGHGTAPESQSVANGSKASAPTAPYAEGYTFGGWYTEAECTTAFNFDTPITAPVTLYAKWTEEQTLTPTELTIEAVTAQKTYDGTPLKAPEYNENGYTNGYKIPGLEGYTVSGLTVTGEATKPGDAGTTHVDASNIKITDSAGTDVTSHFSVKTTDGKLTINKRSLVITAISDSKEYNGQTIKASELTKEGFTDGYSLSGDGLVSGQTLSLITVNGEGKEANEYTTSIDKPDEITVSIDKDNNVTDCYDISTVDGKLTITKRSVTITAISGPVPATGETVYGKNYSGNGYTSGYKAEGLLEGHKLQGDFVTGSGKEGEFVTDIDTSKVKILDGTTDVTANYDIKTVAGKIRIVAKDSSQTPITVTVSASKVYDATPLTVSNSNIKVTQGTLPSNYTLEASFGPTTSITDVQKVSVSLSDVKVKDASGKDVTDQYKITTVSGTLEVTKKPLTLTAESASKTYDGKALVNRNVRATALASKDHVLSVEYEITNSDGNVIKNGAVNVGTYTKRITTVTIKEGSKDVTSNYAITKIDGKLTITAGSTTKNDSSQPKTGDNRHMGLWISILVASVVLLVLIAYVLIKRGKMNKGSKPQKAQKAPKVPKKK